MKKKKKKKKKPSSSKGGADEKGKKSESKTCSEHAHMLTSAENKKDSQSSALGGDNRVEIAQYASGISERCSERTFSLEDSLADRTH